MQQSIFNPELQNENFTSKIVAGLERISQSFRSLLWEHAKVVGLSPIQIQILIFIAYHKPELNKVSHLAKEFNVTKPTISDAIRILDKKGLVFKEALKNDSRSYTLTLSNSGKQMVAATDEFAKPIFEEIEKSDPKELEILYNSLQELIFNLHKTGILSVQRTCYACSFYEHKHKKHFCHFLNQKLLNREIRIDCPEFAEKDPAVMI